MSKGLYGITTPPSALSPISNGLREYSPFLCGVALTEALIDIYRCWSTILEQLLETIMLLHLCNMLCAKRYLPPNFKDPYFILGNTFRTSVFVDGDSPTTMPAALFRLLMPAGKAAKAPSSDFAGALQARFREFRPSARRYGNRESTHGGYSSDQAHEDRAWRHRREHGVVQSIPHSSTFDRCRSPRGSPRYVGPSPQQDSQHGASPEYDGSATPGHVTTGHCVRCVQQEPIVRHLFRQFHD